MSSGKRSGRKGRMDFPKEKRPAKKRKPPSAAKSPGAKPFEGLQEEKSVYSSGRGNTPGRKHQFRRPHITEVSHPEIGPSTFDAGALLSSVMDKVGPLLHKEMDRICAEIAAGIDSARLTPDDPASLRRELERVVMPQLSEALRAAVVEGIRTRQFHLAQLAVIDRAAAQASSLNNLRERINRELEKAGLSRVAEPSDLMLFNLVEEPGPSAVQSGSSKPAYEIITPAYIDQSSGQVVERGWLRRSEEPTAMEQPQHPQRSSKAPDIPGTGSLPESSEPPAASSAEDHAAPEAPSAQEPGMSPPAFSRELMQKTAGIVLRMQGRPRAARTVQEASQRTDEDSEE
ncbi:hypothetical protein [Streptomyces sp. URMC 125]|uniref:hypothetical protein n=1 Tax=Streptomyces sp. URMC 125 TaxID=3423419 RepID=UPI003F1AC6F2